MINLLSIINGITKTLELSEKVLPLVTNYKKEIGNTIGVINKIINAAHSSSNETTKKVATNPVPTSQSTLTFFQ